tara:strand:- start:59 stop:493 length:435 start_codon:yes stop_codon:yes gene_type:complete
MNSELKALYRDTLLEHSREPKNNRVLKNADAYFELKNPLCGDLITIYLKVSHSMVSEVTFEAQCCSICTASASMLTDQITKSDIEGGIDFADSLIESLLQPGISIANLENEEIQSLAGVKSFPSRIRCATLPWEAFKGAVSRLV